MFFRFLFSYSCNKVSISSNNISLQQCNLHSRAIAESKTVHLESQKLDCFLIFLCSCSCCKKMEGTYHAHSLWKQLPRWYFVSKTLKIKNYPCHMSAPIVTTSSQFVASIENYRIDAHQLIPLEHTIVELKSHFLFHSLSEPWRSRV